MKKYILLLFLVGIVDILNAQIALEQSYSDELGLSIIKLEKSGYKYVQYDFQNLIVKLYNMNHSVFKTISLPTIEPIDNKLSIAYISENLFNKDDKVEVLCFKGSWNPTRITNVGSIKVISEDGIEIFSEDSMAVVPQRSATYYGYDDKSCFIYDTENGVKMILYSYKYTDKGFKVYSLPGSLISSIDSKVINTDKSFAYPNPSYSQITIPYDLADNKYGTITIFDSKGRVIDNLKIDESFDNVFVDVSNFQNGLYMYAIISNDKVIGNGKFLVSR